MKMAADYVCCTERTLYNTAKRDPEFQKRLRRARLSPELLCLKTLSKASHNDENWRAAIHMMKHLYPERYARKPNTMPIEQVKELIVEVVAAIDSVVTDDRTRARIGHRVEKVIRRMHSGKAQRRRNHLPSRA
jgi:hypothetical protein